MAAFDPNAAAAPDSGIFGLTCAESDARVVLVPVAFDATTSYRRGTAEGPAAILRASRQVDLFDREVGRPYAAGIVMRDEPPAGRELNARARAAADPIIAAGGAEGRPDLVSGLDAVNRASTRLNDELSAEVAALLAGGKIVGVVGGDHSTPFGSLRAHADHFGAFGILHLDAHADLRPAYEGFTDSHASIMYNAHTRLASVGPIVQVAVRDFSEQEAAIIDASRGRIVTHFDADRARAALEGEPFARFAQRVIARLPDLVYVSYDIDGLDPTLCPNTGTPVPGGLSFHEACYLLRAVVASGRRIIGFDLTEVAPGPGGDEWDANVGARLLYKMIGWALLSARPSGLA